MPFACTPAESAPDGEATPKVKRTPPLEALLSPPNGAAGAGDAAADRGEGSKSASTHDENHEPVGGFVGAVVSPSISSMVPPGPGSPPPPGSPVLGDPAIFQRERGNDCEKLVLVLPPRLPLFCDADAVPIAALRPSGVKYADALEEAAEEGGGGDITENGPFPPPPTPRAATDFGVDGAAVASGRIDSPSEIGPRGPADMSPASWDVAWLAPVPPEAESAVEVFALEELALAALDCGLSGLRREANTDEKKPFSDDVVATPADSAGATPLLKVPAHGPQNPFAPTAPVEFPIPPFIESAFTCQSRLPGGGGGVGEDPDVGRPRCPLRPRVLRVFSRWSVGGAPVANMAPFLFGEAGGLGVGVHPAFLGPKLKAGGNIPGREELSPAGGFCSGDVGWTGRTPPENSNRTGVAVDNGGGLPNGDWVGAAGAAPLATDLEGVGPKTKEDAAPGEAAATGGVGRAVAAGSGADWVVGVGTSCCLVWKTNPGSDGGSDTSIMSAGD